MKIALLGAAGAMAEVVRRDLHEFAPAAEVTIVDLKELAAKYPNERPATVDVRDEAATARLLAGHDAVLNCVTYYWNLPVMRAALASRVPYSDLGGLYHGTRKQFELHDEFVAAGVPALLGMGSTPGITNAMAGFLARELDRVHEVHVRVGCLDRLTPGASGPLPIPYALDTVLDEFALEPYVVEAGRAHPVAPRSGEEEIDFPPPVGRMRAIYTLHSEVAMFARSYPGLAAASFKVAFEPSFMEKVRFLVELGFADREPRVAGASPRQMLLALGGDQISPAGEPDDCDCLRVDLAGEVDGRPVRRRGESLIGPHREWGVGAGALDTGVPLAIAGVLLAEGAVATPGVLCPETALPFERFFAELAKRGIPVAFTEQGQLDD
ncbi:MAG: saccharopine dehydrogenase C-terminal domain-containing protein [Thermoanaerobaculia bacterium]